MSMRHVLGCVIAVSSLTACDPAPVTDAGTLPADTGGPDGWGSSEDGGMADAGVPGADAGPAASFETPLNTWTYVAIPGGECGNGSAYGVAVNRSTASDRVMVYLQGGGACWDDFTCNLLPIASHVRDTLSEADVLGEAMDEEGYLFSRDAATSPFADATFVYLPYCTGDVHSGNSVGEYGGGTIHHSGYNNVSGVLASLQASFSGASRVWLTGSSAGGYGTLVNWYRFRETFPGVRVDVLDDSGPPVDISPSRWTDMMASWQVPQPTGCTDCLDALSNVSTYYRTTVTDGDRFALLQYTQDNTISGYTGLDGSVLETSVMALVEPFAATSSHRIFVLSGSSHVVLTDPSRTSGGVVARDWVRAFATDGSGWDNVVP